MRVTLLAGAVALACSGALAEEAIIMGNVESKCVINTDTTGVYGNPVAGKLSTDTADGGVEPIIRYDVALGGSYTARIVAPSSFSSSPVLTDTVFWEGSSAVKEVSDTAMADYEDNAVTYDYTTEYDLHTAGTTWFSVDSLAEYGYGKAYPAGEYRAIVTAECIAN
jgi:hypothetical protein